MNIIKTGMMPNGTEIRIENWKPNYDFMEESATIGAYPICKSGHYDRPFGPRGGEKFRFALTFPNKDEALKAFEALETGSPLTDFLQYANNPHNYNDCL